ncbi:MAG: hypothetical protein JO163_23615 [Methylobacteriaceae bacterium]|nr:hypothetical protein [Methylobacteriaceae bacterium]MBV9705726.1 hypothetical protein [Methylobacteriaceae bacterium]
MRESRQRRVLAIVKLGGSHALATHLKDWLCALAGCGGRVVIVPGGGPFADVVRQTQHVIGFNDRAAHRMALLAMEQFATAICSLEPTFVLAASRHAIEAAVRLDRTAVWLAARMALAAADLPASWDLTSDSLAAWLACRLGAQFVVLVKHGAFASDRLEANDLAARGVVDPLFPKYLRTSLAQGALARPSEYASVAQAIHTGVRPGTRIELAT